MSIDNRLHVILFAVGLGVAAYLVSALWSALFIVTLPMAKDGILDSVEVVVGADKYGNEETQWYPGKFKNSLEELKYYHNLEMGKRNRNFRIGELVFGGMLGVIAFWLIPIYRKRNETQHEPGVLLLSGAFFGVLSVLVVPFLLSVVLPSPVKWFPKEIVEINVMREKEVMKRLEIRAKELEAEKELDQ